MDEIEKKTTKKPAVDKKLEKKKRKKLLKAKKSRIIIRNAPFKVKEDILKKEFSKFGKVVEVSIPKNSDGKMYGFCFVGFDAINSALKAIKEMNGKQLMGRTIAVDFALAKKRFQSHNDSESLTSIKEESDDQQKDIEAEEEEEEEEEDNSEIKTEPDEEGDEDNDEMNDSIDEEDEDELPKKKINPKIMNDASEEQTLFVRNLSFLTTVETLNEFMGRFGETHYSKICVDPFTEHSKGTAFVKFKNKEAADKCLEAFQTQESDFCLDGRQLMLSLAVTRNKLKDLQEKRLTKDKDKRNLYLAKEGLIYPESPAAEGVSQSDLAKRLALETRKRKMLQNNHFFISRTRLCVHNLPENFDKNMLRKVFLKAVDDKKAQIIEARVMYDIRKSDLKFGKSKGFGFVEFKDHIHALKALRHLNNNPNIFSRNKRPIVEFSIENKVALNKKRHRTEKNLKNKEVTVEDNDDLPEENTGFSGVMSRPDKPNQKIKAPKVNRKLGEMQKQLKSRKKKIRKNKLKDNNERRHKLKVEKRKLNKKETKEIQDRHDSHYKKRKNIFKDDKRVSQPVKKVKWFSD